MTAIAQSAADLAPIRLGRCQLKRNSPTLQQALVFGLTAPLNWRGVEALYAPFGILEKLYEEDSVDDSDPARAAVLVRRRREVRHTDGPNNPRHAGGTRQRLTHTFYRRL